MKMIKNELLYTLTILIVQMLFFIYFIKQGCTLKELVCSYTFLIFWGTYLICRILIFIVIRKFNKNKKES
ncbi:hypothetical protein [Lachnoanaerobaculum saburreum]|uniref:Uncharacterized protein n=1 Tax=Lachnoanaerobaculum saburreum DSM 3986 TaxID=887325 RepID=E6LR65_9FIRM|nr:hypothetical protein [Lachnoanaerobaculum saburreum]EFU75657.1 hypothetical protein HMPREF0381_2450 [Lachnoanaerobaculum saburreum DSM 3986]RKW49673.1 MAG: hypothetical protein D8H95_19935 [Lachnospiraceae bacterium]